MTSFAEVVELGPTIFEPTGIDPNIYPHNGKSLLSIIIDELVTHREFVFSEGVFFESEKPIIERASYPYGIKFGLQHEDTRCVGRVVAIRNNDFTYVLRL